MGRNTDVVCIDETACFEVYRLIVKSVPVSLPPALFSIQHHENASDCEHRSDQFSHVEVTGHLVHIAYGHYGASLVIGII